jgi:NAD(P)-dependent dehydrogenase (short-subunit alcohol dehydrogenase family)
MPLVRTAMPDCQLLVNNASIFDRVNFMQTDERLFDRNFTINFKAPVFLTQDFASHCKHGLVVNILDTKINRPSINYFAYAMSKRALADFTLSAAKELAPTIRVNGVCPGMTLAPTGKEEGYLHRLSTAVPLKRPGNPQQIASAVLFLLDNDFITGQILYIDGGEHIGDDIRVIE